MSAILGGLFNSRLNMKLREEKGYTYGAHAGFDLRRAAGPFSARAAVNTEVTAAALSDLLAELERIRSEPVTEAEVRAARDFLIGVFPLRFETPGPVVGALSGMVVHGLPDDELATYRARIEAVTVDDVLTAARGPPPPRGCLGDPRRRRRDGRRRAGRARVRRARGHPRRGGSRGGLTGPGRRTGRADPGRLRRVGPVALKPSRPRRSRTG